MTEPINTGDKSDNRQSDGKFGPGNTANPSGRPKGSRNKATMACESLMEGQAEQLGQKAIDLALEGDSTALRLCMERVSPVRKGRPVPLSLPDITDAKSLAEAGAVVGRALASGELSAEEASGVISTLDGIRKLHETSELEQRISELERAAMDNKK